MLSAWILTAVLAVLCGLHSCDETKDKALSEATNCFTLNFYKLLTEGQKNMVSSPFSLDVLLSLLRVGSGGTTEQEFTKALGYQGLSVQDMQDAFRSKLEKLKGSSGNTLEVANSVWIQENFQIKQSFKDDATKNFYAEISNVDFKKPEPTTDKINGWGKEKTHGLIPVLFDDPLDQSTIMVLVNAIYFKGEWQTKFEKEETQPGDFYNNDDKNSPSKVDLMHQQTQLRYANNAALGAQVLEMDYVGRDMSMVIILPNENSNLKSLESSLTCGAFKKAVSSGTSTLVDVTMPKFEISSEYDLNGPIQKAGMEEMFTAGANFSGIAQGIAVSQAIQKAIIKVYEEGSEAAVLTGIGMARTTSVDADRPEPVIFRADRPFIYLIKHKPTDLVLFVGRVKELPGSPS